MKFTALEIACRQFGSTEQRSKLCGACKVSLQPSQLLAYIGNDDEATGFCAHCGGTLEDESEDKGETDPDELGVSENLHSESDCKTREEFTEGEDDPDYDAADSGIEGEPSTVANKVHDSQEDWPQNFAHGTCPHCHRKATALQMATRECCLVMEKQD